jgi:hypothetical protein
MPWRPEGPWEGHVPYRWDPLPHGHTDLTPEARRVLALAMKIRRIQARGETVSNPKLIEAWCAAVRAAAYAGRQRKADYTHEAGILNDCIRLAKVTNAATLLAQAQLVQRRRVTACRSSRYDKPSALSYRHADDRTGGDRGGGTR